MTPALSILIPSLNSRRHFLNRMLDSLQAQRAEAVEIVTLIDDGYQSIGAKRNRLLDMARGRYVANVDDDDELSPLYCSSILEAIESNPDVVTFLVQRKIDGKDVCLQTLRLHDDFCVTHLCPIRADLARTGRYPDADQGEDNAWVKQVRPYLKTERHVPEVLYTYLFRTERPGEISHLYRKDFNQI